MNKEIAIVTDSSSDVPQEYIDKYNIFVVPLKVIKNGETFIDGVDITATEVYNDLAKYDFKTSLPSGADFNEKLDEISKLGYKQVIMITLSSGLSGTYNIANLIASDYEGLEIEVIDSLNVGIGSGLHVIYAAELIDKGYPFKEAVEIIKNKIQDGKVFFCINTLEYLKKGGRIGKVSAVLGGILDLKPIITCNTQGIYTTIAKVRSRKQSLLKTVEIVAKEAAKYINVKIALAYGEYDEDVIFVKEKIKEKISNMKVLLEGQISPVLVVHTGPGLIGIAVYGEN